LFQIELENVAMSRWTCFGVGVPRTLDYPIRTNVHRMITMHLHPRQTDRRTSWQQRNERIAR